MGINRTGFRSWQLIPQSTPISIAIGTSGTSFHVFGKFGTKVSERPDASKFRADIYLFYNRSRQRIPPKFWSLFARLCGVTAQKFKTSLTLFQEFGDEPCERRVPYSLMMHLYHSLMHRLEPLLLNGKAQQGWSQWPLGLRPRSAAARLLRSWVRIPPGAWMFVCCECCVLSVRGLCDELITRPEESYQLWCVVVCDLETSRMRRP